MKSNDQGQAAACRFRSTPAKLVRKKKKSDGKVREENLAEVGDQTRRKVRSGAGERRIEESSITTTKDGWHREVLLSLSGGRRAEA